MFPAGWRGRLRLAGWITAGVLLVAAPFWGPRALSHLAFFRMQKVEFRGMLYIAESDLLERLAVDTTMSLWTDLAVLESRLEDHPQIRDVNLSRKLPGTLVVTIDEKRPVALVATTAGFDVVDDQGLPMPVDPTKGEVDLPILRSADSVLVVFLSQLREEYPALYARVSEVSRVGKNEVRIDLFELPVRAMADITVARFADILPVERDLMARGVKVVELDLRYRDQVIARKK